MTWNLTANEARELSEGAVRAAGVARRRRDPVAPVASWDDSDENGDDVRSLSSASLNEAVAQLILTFLDGPPPPWRPAEPDERHLLAEP
jgi:hypothetical protein